MNRCDWPSTGSWACLLLQQMEQLTNVYLTCIYVFFYRLATMSYAFLILKTRLFENIKSRNVKTFFNDSMPCDKAMYFCHYGFFLYVCIYIYKIKKTVVILFEQSLYFVLIVFCLYMNKLMVNSY